MYANMQAHLQRELDEIRAAGLYKTERVIAVSYTHLTLPTNSA